MEKLIYVLAGAKTAIDGRVDSIAESSLSAVRAEGGEQIAILVPDQINQILERSPGRIIGKGDQIAAVFECWLPTVDARAAVEETLAPHAEALWGYLVTESTVVTCPHVVEEGGRVPGITQWGANDKPQAVALNDFYREWAVHSEISFGLHPERESYIRNAVARSLTVNTPVYQGIVLERFPSLDIFTDDSVYFGDPAVVTEMFEHLPTFFEFETAISVGLSEFRWK